MRNSQPALCLPIPAKIGEVSNRFGTPYVAIVLCMAVGLVLLAINTFVTTALFVYLTLGSIYIAVAADNLLTCLLGVVFPYMRRRIFEASPAKRYAPAGIPIITISGIIGVVVLGVSAVACFTDPAYGISTIPWYEAFLIATFVVPALSYFAIRLYRRRRGINLDAAFAQIPPE